MLLQRPAPKGGSLLSRVVNQPCTLERWRTCLTPKRCRVLTAVRRHDQTLCRSCERRFRSSLYRHGICCNFSERVRQKSSKRVPNGERLNGVRVLRPNGLRERREIVSPGVWRFPRSGVNRNSLVRKSRGRRLNRKQGIASLGQADSVKLSDSLSQNVGLHQGEVQETPQNRAGPRASQQCTVT